VSIAASRCAMCGHDLLAAQGPRIQPAVVGMTEQHQLRAERARRLPGSLRDGAERLRPAVFASAAVLLLAIGGTAAFFFLTREPLSARGIPADTSAVSPVTPADAPLNINGVVLEDGPEVDPTDVIHLVRKRVAEPQSDVELVEILAHRASRGKVNLDDPEASIRYTYLVSRADARASKASKRARERVEIILRAEPPPIQRVVAAKGTTTVPEPLCVWNAAWRAAISSGLSEKDVYEVSYGPDTRGSGGAWTFFIKDAPERRREVDGETCAIKAR
jgi:hypothetical protein